MKVLEQIRWREPVKSSIYGTDSPCIWFEFVMKLYIHISVKFILKKLKKYIKFNEYVKHQTMKGFTVNISEKKILDQIPSHFYIYLFW